MKELARFGALWRMVPAGVAGIPRPSGPAEGRALRSARERPAGGRAAGGSLLDPHGFEKLIEGRGELLRGLRRPDVERLCGLHNDSRGLEILNHGSITEAAGAHRLFNGVRRWSTTGLSRFCGN